jgi:hypothetical protein
MTEKQLLVLEKTIGFDGPALRTPAAWKAQAEAIAANLAKKYEWTTK